MAQAAAQIQKRSAFDDSDSEDDFKAKKLAPPRYRPPPKAAPKKQEFLDSDDNRSDLKP